MILDKSLVRIFGLMKFKVRIIKKLAQYGIKFYVVMDSKTDYVLKSIVYTGKAVIYKSITYLADKEMIRLVKSIFKKITGNYCTIYPNMFYTPIDLLREIYDMLPFDTGTYMENHITKGLVVAKRFLE